MAREIIWHKVIQKMTFARLANLVQAIFGLITSRITHKPVVFGIPPILQMEPTNHCNLKCPLCDVGNGRMTRARGFFDLGQWQRLIDNYGDKLSCILFYHQGEPLLAANFVELVRTASRKKIYTTCSTNGQLITPDLARKIVGSGLDCLIVSYDGFDQDSYATYRRNGHFKNVQQAIRNLREAKESLRSKTPYIIIQCLLHRQNENQRYLIYQQGKQLRADRILFKNIQVTSTAEAQKWLPQNSKFSRYNFTDNKLKLQKKSPTFCPRPWTTSLINWDGSVVPCCFDKNATNVMGNLDRETLDKIWNGKKYLNFRNKMIRKDALLTMCRQCHQGRRIWLRIGFRRRNEI